MSADTKKKMTIAPLCRHKGAGHVRGLCRKCYQAVFRRVVNGTATWEELEKRGLVLPSEQGQRPSEYGAKVDESFAKSP